ncbi:MAG: 2-oxoglutarate dehydrogenase E1 component [Candidatus Sericytochromatia bacterium]|nr:2-oxoglutarate dehydrogenase E1 component [Candidatus Sericytochromatia bacterium]
MNTGPSGRDYLANLHPAYLDSLYQTYLNQPDQLEPSWRYFFDGFALAQQGPAANGQQAAQRSQREIEVEQLIHVYRARAHLAAKTNPVRPRRQHKVELAPSDFGLSEGDLDTRFQAGKALGLEAPTLRQIIERLEAIYTGPLGFEYMYIRDPERLKWLQQRIEQHPGGTVSWEPPLEIKKRLLQKLNEATVFEQFLHKKFVGQKRFSLEGGENTIPALDRLIQQAASTGAAEVVIGMAHRGRLNVLTNIMGKTYEQVFTEFDGVDQPEQTMGDGDVKYHLGYTSRMQTPDGEVYLKLVPNPSHLEAVNPVVLGYSRAQIDDEYRGDKRKAIPVLLHGDAAIAGQGIVYEIAQMSQLEGYHCGGTIHFVINNQIGFTTDYHDARTSIYCTDVAKIIDAPVIHVNGDDAEAVAFAVQLAVDYRQTFLADIFVDMVCYRKHGHNEGDEPKFTQPQLYKLIGKHPAPREIYNQRLIERGEVDAELGEQMQQAYYQLLQERLDEVRQEPVAYMPTRLEEEWHTLSYAGPDAFEASPETAITPEALEQIGRALTQLPEGFKPLKKAQNILTGRRSGFFEKQQLDWATAELSAWGSLLLDNKMVRISGQDVIRGTFSQRHAMFFDAESNSTYCGLNHISPEQPRQLAIYNSLLSEYGVMGFEYGYAMATPQALVLWEAQFGDFANGAQVMIDQFISSAESKWQRMNGLVLLLPHGYEGQGPEHSNARPERFLQLCADNNMVVANLTEPANYFHLLRRQLAWPFRKPCVVMTPKSLLRHPRCVSPLEDFTQGGFREVIDDPLIQKPQRVQHLILCSGKIYYDLLAHRESLPAEQQQAVALIRLEQLAPLPLKQLQQVLGRYSQAQSRFWVQEEPENMGYWTYLLRTFRAGELALVSRRLSASPATGYHKQHARESNEILQRAFAPVTHSSAPKEEMPV